MSTTEPTPTCTEGCIVDNDESVCEVSTCKMITLSYGDLYSLVLMMTLSC